MAERKECWHRAGTWTGFTSAAKFQAGHSKIQIFTLCQHMILPVDASYPFLQFGWLSTKVRWINLTSYCNWKVGGLKNVFFERKRPPLWQVSQDGWCGNGFIAMLHCICTHSLQSATTHKLRDLKSLNSWLKFMKCHSEPHAVLPHHKTNHRGSLLCNLFYFLF